MSASTKERLVVLPDSKIDDRPGDSIWAMNVHRALRESYAIIDHLTIDHRARGCNESCDWWPRVQAIKGRNK